MMSVSTPAGTRGFAEIQALGRPLSIEYELIAADKPEADLIIFLHEGLGSLSMWKDWPARVCEAAGCRGLVYSRNGYGASTPRGEQEHWPVTYMHDQAREALPALLRALGLENERPVLFGHSDGASIALLYGAMYPERVKAIAVAAPHVFVEDITVESICAARQAWLETDLPQRLGRYHQYPELTFWGWNDIWLDPAFRDWNIEEAVSGIRCPLCVIQGREDEYGTLRQVESIRKHAPQTRALILDNCRHSPHKDQPAAVITEISALIHSLD